MASQANISSFLKKTALQTHTTDPTAPPLGQLMDWASSRSSAFRPDLRQPLVEPWQVDNTNHSHRKWDERKSDHDTISSDDIFLSNFTRKIDLRCPDVAPDQTVRRFEDSWSWIWEGTADPLSARGNEWTDESWKTIESQTENTHFNLGDGDWGIRETLIAIQQFRILAFYFMIYYQNKQIGLSTLYLTNWEHDAHRRIRVSNTNIKIISQY